MGGPRFLVVQPDPGDPLGPLEQWLRRAEAELDVVCPQREEMPRVLDGYTGMVCLGGPMGAYDDAKYPWLAQLRDLLATAVSSRIPLLAICLGAQLLAVATGGAVRRIPDGPEIGTLLVTKRDIATADPLFADLPFMPDVLQFHSDEVYRLPPEAQLLASAPKCVNQAFRVGESAYGLQFHIETTPELVLTWAGNNPDMVGHARRHEMTTEHLERVHADLAETWQPFAERFVRLAAGNLLPDPSAGRNLPLV